MSMRPSESQCIAALKLGLCTRKLGVDVINDALLELADVISERVFIRIQSIVTQIMALPEGADYWLLETTMRDWSDKAFEAHSEFNRWYSLGASLARCLSEHDMPDANQSSFECATQCFSELHETGHDPLGMIAQLRDRLSFSNELDKLARRVSIAITKPSTIDERVARLIEKARGRFEGLKKLDLALLEILIRANTRLTGTQLHSKLTLLTRWDSLPSLSVVKTCLASLVDRGVLNSRRRKPIGYALASWSDQ